MATPRYQMKQNDTFPPIRVTAYDPEGLPMYIPLGTVVWFILSKNLRGGIVLRKLGTVVSNTGGVVQYDWQTGDTNRIGGFLGEFELNFPDGSVLSIPNADYIEIEIIPELG